jgi:aspartyl-tRNA(Asn)/glutamyl-tRNA(Gln) amidotransferase subunit B
VAADLFEGTVGAGADAKKAANLILNDVARARPESSALSATDLAPRLAKLIAMVDAGTLSSSASRQVLPHLVLDGKEPAAVMEELGLAQVSDSGALEAAVRSAIEANPAAVADYRAGKVTAINFLKGQVMKATRGAANPAVAEQLLRRQLDAVV